MNTIETTIESTNETATVKRCGKCKIELPISAFSAKRSGKTKSICDHCLAWLREYYAKKKCLHGKYLYFCKECCARRKQIKNNLKT